MIVYLARDIPAFVMYCVNGESGSSLPPLYDIYIYIEREREREKIRAVELSRKLASLAIIDMYHVYKIYVHSKLGEK